jgi:hypothetical protein
MLTDVFICTESVGNDFTDSFLDSDCEQFCWKGDHLIYAIFAFVSFVLYVPLVVFTRPVWQYFLHDLHIFTVPRWFLFKSALQVFLISMSKTVRKQEQLAHHI